MDTLQIKLEEMEQKNPSQPRRISLKERVQSLLLPLKTRFREVDYADPEDARQAQRNYAEFGSYDKKTAYATEMAEIAMNAKCRIPDQNDNLRDLLHKAYFNFNLNEAAGFALQHYLERGWEVPEALLQRHQESAEAAFNSTFKVLRNPHTRDINLTESLRVLDDATNCAVNRLRNFRRHGRSSVDKDNVALILGSVAQRLLAQHQGNYSHSPQFQYSAP